ncbi:MAG: glycoside hydrolase family 31 protein, partial [Clostridia bacterium]|nr:glycoside hydrolase family 31 protein [Clostridia bacterium]
AYKAKNQYYFGTEMIVAPVLKYGKNGEVKVKAYLPEGGYTDFFTGEKYKGGQYVEVVCPLERIPVFVKDGGIVPMLAERKGNSQEFDELEVRVFKGNGEYTMYDEKGSIFFKISDDGKFVVKPSSDSVTKKITINYEGKLMTIDAKECEIQL